MSRPVGVAVLLTALMAACGEKEFEPPDRSERVERAAAAYSTSMFDSIGWDDGEIRHTQGNAVYAAVCRRCHGAFGEGTTAYARGQGMDAPPLVGDSATAESLDELRRAVYSGHASGMPVFGEGALTTREIDAVAAYVVEVLRPDEAGTAPGG